MSQVFVPNVGLNLNQGKAQQGAQLNTNIPFMVDPADNLKGFNKLADTFQGIFEQADKMQVAADALAAEREYRDQVTDFSNAFGNLKNNEAVKHAPIYGEQIAKAKDNVLNRVDDPRVKQLVSKRLDEVEFQAQTWGKNYTTEQQFSNFSANAIASLKQSMGAVVQAHTTGDPRLVQNAKSDAESKLNLVIQQVNGLDPASDAGMVFKQDQWKGFYKALTQHAIDNQAFSMGTNILNQGKNDLDPVTYMQLSDDLLVAQRAFIKANSAISSGNYKIDERAFTQENHDVMLAKALKDRAEQLKINLTPDKNGKIDFSPVIQALGETTYKALDANAWVSARQITDDAVQKLKVAENTNGALEQGALSAITSMQETGRDLNGNIIPDEDLQNVDKLITHLPDGIKQGFNKLKGGTQAAADYIKGLIIPASFGNVALGREYLAHFDRYFAGMSENEIKAKCRKDGIAVDVTEQLVKMKGDENYKREQAENGKVIIAGAQQAGYKDAVDSTKTKKDPALASQYNVIHKSSERFIADYRRQNPNANFGMVTVALSNYLRTDPVVSQEIDATKKLDDFCDLMASYAGDAGKYSKEYLYAVAEFEGLGNSTMDSVASSARLLSAAKADVNNANFRKAYPTLPEVIRYKNNLRMSEEARRQASAPTTSPFAKDMTIFTGAN